MSVLERIFEGKRAEVEAAQTAVPLEEMRRRASGAGPVRGFKSALERTEGLALIAEVKKASPSQGLIRADFDPAEIAAAYERAGASCLSVLTDKPNFQGSLENLGLARAATSLPCLRKDFIYDPYQIFESRAWGADAILLIVAALSPTQLSELQALAWSLGMDALVEVHGEAEAAVALNSGASLIGINNRNLADFTTDLAVTERLAPLVAPHAYCVSESALETRADLHRVAAAGANGVLIGTAFCAAANVEGKVHEVMGWSE